MKRLEVRLRHAPDQERVVGKSSPYPVGEEPPGGSPRYRAGLS